MGPRCSSCPPSQSRIGRALPKLAVETKSFRLFPTECFRASSTSVFCLKVARVCASDSDVCLQASLLAGRRLLIEILTESFRASESIAGFGLILWDQPPAAGFTGTWDYSAATEARLHVSLISSSKIVKGLIHLECFSVSLAICEFI